MNAYKYIILFFMAVTAISCGNKNKAVEEAPVANGFSQEFLQRIATAEATARNIEQQLKLTGKVEYDPDRMVRYVPLVSGVVVSTHFSLGDRVTQGQTLVVIRSSELSALYAEKQSLEAEIAVLNRNLESTRSMYDDNLSSQKDLIEAQSRLKQAEAELGKVNSTLSSYGVAGGNGAKTFDGTFTLKAPISGFITERNIAPGSPISADGEALFTVADISKVWITANVYAGNLVFVKPGMSVDIRTSAYPDEVFEGKIDIIPQVFDSEEHVLKARIVMPNTDLKFKPEMAVDLTLKDSREVKMACIPSDALIFDGNRYFVVRQEGSAYTVSEVKLYAQNHGLSYLESGIRPGDMVVVKNQLLMYNQLKG